MSTPSLARRFVRLQFGLFAFAVAIALMVEAHVGLDPWSALHDGLATRTGLTFGRVTQIIGLALILVAAQWLAVRPGLGTVFNMLVIGPWFDLVHDQPWFPTWTGGLPGVAQFVAGMVLMGVATALYIGADLGAGPRDGFILGLSQRLGASIRATRIGIEVTVLASGWLLGGQIGLGTVLFALGMGPIMQACLVWMDVRPPVRAAPAESTT